MGPQELENWLNDVITHFPVPPGHNAAGPRGYGVRPYPPAPQRSSGGEAPLPPLPTPPPPRPPFTPAPPAQVLFDTGRFDLQPRYIESLRAVARYLAGHPHVTVRLTGHADPRGRVRDNRNLGMLRAEAVAQQLLRFGVPAARIRRVSSGGEAAAARAHPAPADYAWYRFVFIEVLRR